MNDQSVNDRAPDLDWTPTEGMLVERISDGECFRLRIRSPQRLGDFDLVTPTGNRSPYMPFSVPDLRAMFRPRCLRKGDVVTKVKMRSGVIYVNEALISVDSDTAETDGCWFTTRDVLHVEGLGPVPWPTREEAPISASVGWTPVEGMLIERISDEECYQVYEVDRDVCRIVRVKDCWVIGESLTKLFQDYHPRYPRVGDVIEKVELPSGPMCEATPVSPSILSIRDGWVDATNGESYPLSHILHIRDIGPMPWPGHGESPKGEICEQQHAIGPPDVCQCGSTHSWELAKHGFCHCQSPQCLLVHRRVREKEIGV